MRVGISVQSFYPVDDPRQGARFMIERAGAAEAAGLDSLFVGDHHATPLPYYQNSAILGRMLAEWGNRPAGALYLLPLWHPLLLAEQVGTLAAIMQGRFILQCAIGPDDVQFPAMGIPARQRPSRFEESLSILRKLFAGETVTCDGRYTLHEARISPRPSQPVEVWIGAVAPAAVERAARLGDGWLGAPAFGREMAERQIDVYREACGRVGQAVGTCAIRRDIYVGESAEEARATAAPVIEGGYRGFPPDAPMVGSIEEVAESFRRFGAMGYDEIVVRHLVQDQEKVLASIARLAEVKALLR